MNKSRSAHGLVSLQELLGAASKPEMPATTADWWGQIGKRLKRQRVAFEWTEADVAERAGVATTIVQAMEQGHPTSAENLFCLLSAFGHGPDLLRMLESPNFPTLRAHERYVEMKNSGSV